MRRPTAAALPAAALPTAAVLAVVLALVSPGCRPDATPRQQVTTLYFGLRMPGGAEVTAAEWGAFVDKQVVPMFPAGFTVLEGRGRWQENGVGYGEPSRLLIVVHPADGPAGSKLDVLRDLYRTEFGQSSVLRVDQPADRVAF